MDRHRMFRTFANDCEVTFYFAFEWERAPDWNFQQYRIPAMTFWYVMEGSRRLIMPDAEYTVAPGSIAALPAHATVTTAHTGPEPAPIRYFSMGIQAIVGGIEWSELYGIPVVFPAAPGAELDELTRIWSEVKDEASRIKQQTPSSSVALPSARQYALALTWEAKLKRWVSLMTRIALPHMAAPEPISDHRVRDICAYIRTHYHQPLTSEDLAKAACLSEGHMRAIFREVTGISPHQYLLRVRMEKAKELLVSTRLSLSDIAGKVGFEDVSYFISMFRKREGTTPSAYRKRQHPWGTG